MVCKLYFTTEAPQDTEVAQRVFLCAPLRALRVSAVKISITYSQLWEDLASRLILLAVLS